MALVTRHPINIHVDSSTGHAIRATLTTPTSFRSIENTHPWRGEGAKVWSDEMPHTEWQRLLTAKLITVDDE